MFKTANFALNKLFKVISPDIEWDISHPEYPNCDEYAPYSSSTYAFVLHRSNFYCEPCDLSTGLITNHSNSVFLLRPAFYKHFPTFAHFEVFVYYITPLIQQNLNANVFSINNIILFFIPIKNETFDYDRITSKLMPPIETSNDEHHEEEEEPISDDEWIF